jgi:hypothetical protein
VNSQVKNSFMKTKMLINDFTADVKLKFLDLWCSITRLGDGKKVHCGSFTNKMWPQPPHPKGWRTNSGRQVIHII